MRVIPIRLLREFWERSPETRYAQTPLSSWYKTVKAATWSGPDDVKALYRHASVLKGGRVVFNIAGNKLRIVASINYPAKVVYIKFVGTHSEYDVIDVYTVDQSKE